MEQFNQCEGGHGTKDEIRKYPIGSGGHNGNMLLCRDCYCKYRASEIEEERPVYDWTTLEIVQPKIEPPKPTEQEIKDALARLRERFTDYDWTATIADDAWGDHVQSRLPEYLSEEEHEFFHEADEDREALGEAIELVTRMFVAWLAETYNPENRES